MLPNPSNTGFGFPAGCIGLHCIAVTKWTTLWIMQFKIFKIFKYVPYPYPIHGMKHPSATLGELMLAGYYVWDTKAMWSDSHTQSPSHRQSSMWINGSMIDHAAQIMQRINRFQQMEKARRCQWRLFPLRIHRGGDPHHHWPVRWRKTSAVRHQAAASRPTPASPLVPDLWLRLCLRDSVRLVASCRQSARKNRCKHTGLHCPPSHSDQGWALEHLSAKFVTRLDKKLLTSRKVINLKSDGECQSRPCRHETPFADPGARFLNYFHTFVEK